MNIIYIRALKLCSILSLVTLYSCELVSYQPKGDNHVEISDEPRQYTISFENKRDTLKLWGTVSIDVDQSEAFTNYGEYYLVLDDQKVSDTKGSPYFDLDTQPYQDGLHTIRVVSKVSSGTNSLADKVGAEYQIDTLSKPAYIDNRPVAAVQMKAAKITSDSLLKISWEKYPRHNIQRLKVYEHYGNSRSLRATLENEYQTSWIDSSYDGHLRHYSVAAKQGYNQEVDSDPIAFSYEEHLPTFTEPTQENLLNFTFAWTKYPFAHNFRGYRVKNFKYINDIYKGFFANTITSITDTTQTFTIPFGKPYYPVISSKTVKPNSYDGATRQTISDTATVAVGKKLPLNKCLYIDYSIRRDQYLVHSGDSLHLLNGSNFSRKASHAIADYNLPDTYITHSEGHDYIIIATNDYYYLLDPNDLTLQGKHVLDDILPEPFSQMFNARLTDNGRLWISLADNNSTGTAVIDLSTHTEIPSIRQDSADQFYDVSNTGDYVFTNLPGGSAYPGIHKVQGDTLVPLNILQNPSEIARYVFNFREDLAEAVFITNESPYDIYTLDISSQKQRYLFSTGTITAEYYDTIYLDTDAASGQIAWQNYEMYDTEQEVAIPEILTYGKHQALFEIHHTNGYIFSDYGYYINTADLNDIYTKTLPSSRHSKSRIPSLPVKLRQPNPNLDIR
ncbi:MAG: hypothetical protein ACQETE_10805 [Bacteroidota bacterium]